MSTTEEYRPCRNCGKLTDSGCCSPECARDLEADALFTKRLAAGEIDEDGNELGDYCVWCGEWYSEKADTHVPYCDGVCAIQAEKD